ASISYVSCPACQNYYRRAADGTPNDHNCTCASCGVDLGRGRAVAHDCSLPDSAHPGTTQDALDEADVAAFLGGEVPAPAAASPAAPGPAFPPAEDLSDEAALEEFVLLLGMANTTLPTGLTKDWRALCGKLAQRYMNNPSTRALLDILAAPKIALARLRSPRPQHKITARMHGYPDVPRPPPRKRSLGPSSDRQVSELVHRQLKKGYARRAARVLRAESSIAPLTEDVLAQLRNKHPEGPVNAFQAEGRNPRQHHLAAEKMDVLGVFKSFNREVSGGCSGWTQPLLKIALEEDLFVQFIQLLCRQMALGSAPGRVLLGAASLTPLNKTGGGVRPIAAGELLYRLCAKILLKVLPPSDALLPSQLGVGSPGGVEPIVRLLERFVDGVEGESEFGFLILLDFSNAFNALCRATMSKAILKHCNTLHHFAKWRYNQPSPLFPSGSTTDHHLLSSQGLPQGDPFGPLFFSVTVRDLAAELQDFLGENARLVCYFDDWTILAKDPGVLEKVKAFFARKASAGQSCGLDLSSTKCRELSRDEVQRDGVQVLGTMIGGVEARARFLREKVADEVEVLGRLRSLGRQDALLLLTKSIQHTLRHLLRTLNTDGITNPWHNLDHALHDALVFVRGSSAHDEEVDRILFSLPARLGGCAVPLYAHIAPHARAAMRAESDHTLATRQLLQPCASPVLPRPASLDDTADEERGPRQRDRLKPVWAGMLAFLAVGPSEDSPPRSIDQLVTVLGHSSPLGRRWLSVFPFDINSQLSDREVQVGLQLRTLQPMPHARCLDCGQRASHGHDDICAMVTHRRVKRHNTAARFMDDGLQRV
ncbi:unnamed protein product, partial [Tilletia caries]